MSSTRRTKLAFEESQGQTAGYFSSVPVGVGVYVCVCGGGGGRGEGGRQGGGIWSRNQNY